MNQRAFSLTHSFSWVISERHHPFNRFNGFAGANG
jgi:hypothetical protein